MATNLTVGDAEILAAALAGREDDRRASQHSTANRTIRMLLLNAPSTAEALLAELDATNEPPEPK